jgi:type II secretory pathway pseudopilin PulG
MLLTRRNPRKGLSLLEVILALAVFLLAITGLVFLMGVASDQAIETEMRSQALSLCQSRLAEVSSGAIPLEGKGDAACDDDDDYMWSMDVDSGGFNGLSNVTVHVTRKRANGSKFACSLSQMVLDPKMVGTVFDAAQDLQSSSSDSSSGTDSSSSSSSSSGSGGTPAGGGASSAGKSAAPSSSGKSGGAAPSSGSKTGGSSTSKGGSGKSGS